MNYEMKPCPFCGNSDQKKLQPNDIVEHDWIKAGCAVCDATGPSVDLARPGIVDEDDYRRAVEKWNDRHINGWLTGRVFGRYAPYRSVAPFLHTRLLPGFHLSDKVIRVVWRHYEAGVFVLRPPDPNSLHWSAKLRRASIVIGVVSFVIATGAMIDDVIRGSMSLTTIKFAAAILMVAGVMGAISFIYDVFWGCLSDIDRKSNRKD